MFSFYAYTNWLLFTIPNTTMPPKGQPKCIGKKTTKTFLTRRLFNKSENELKGAVKQGYHMRQSLHIMKPTPQSKKRVVATESESKSYHKSSKEEDSHDLEYPVESNPPLWGNVINIKNPGIWDS